MRYALTTAARNEEQFLEATICSVVEQTLVPSRWIIVSDGSTDATDKIIKCWTQTHPFITFVRNDEKHKRNFAAQAKAINRGLGALLGAGYDLIGNVDADVLFPRTYFEQLIDRMSRRPRLGLAGGLVREQDGHVMMPFRSESIVSVPHALQLFRRECIEEIGCYPALPYGGADTYMEVAARMRGWEVTGYPDLIVQHQRATGSAAGILRGRLRQGMMDYSLGYDPLFEVARCAWRLTEGPLILGSLARLLGFCSSYTHRRARVVSRDFITFLRDEQRSRLGIAGRLLRLFAR